MHTRILTNSYKNSLSRPFEHRKASPSTSDRIHDPARLSKHVQCSFPCLRLLAVPHTRNRSQNPKRRKVQTMQRVHVARVATSVNSSLSSPCPMPHCQVLCTHVLCMHANICSTVHHGATCLFACVLATPWCYSDSGCTPIHTRF